MDPQLVRSQRLGKQVSRELRGWNRSCVPAVPTPTLREKEVSGCGVECSLAGMGGLGLGSRRPKPQGSKYLAPYPPPPQSCGEPVGASLGPRPCLMCPLETSFSL